MALKVKWRIAKPKDVEQISEIMLDTEYISEFYKGQSKEKFILNLTEDFFVKDKCVTVVVCKIGEKIVGYATFGPYAVYAQRKPGFPKETENYAYNLGFGVLKKLRGKEIGTDLLRFMDSRAKKQGYKGMYADIKLPNASSVKAHEKAGYEKVAEITNQKRVIFKKMFLKKSKLKKIISSFS